MRARRAAWPSAPRTGSTDRRLCARLAPAMEGGPGSGQIHDRAAIDASRKRRPHPLHRAGGCFPADLRHQPRQACGRGLRHVRSGAPGFPDRHHSRPAVTLEWLAARVVVVLALPLGQRPVPRSSCRLRPFLEHPNLGVRRVQPDLVCDHARLKPCCPAPRGGRDEHCRPGRSAPPPPRRGSN